MHACCEFFCQQVCQIVVRAIYNNNYYIDEWSSMLTGAGSTNITDTIISMTASPLICQPIVSEMNGKYRLLCELLVVV